eukprot:3336528-Pyramimonas_sp.AAC.1
MMPNATVPSEIASAETLVDVLRLVAGSKDLGDVGPSLLLGLAVAFGMSWTSGWNTAAAAAIPHGLPLSAVLEQDLAGVLHHEVLAAIVVDMGHAVRQDLGILRSTRVASSPKRHVRRK